MSGKFFTKFQKQRSGVISLLALMVMATITAIAITASTLVLTELRATESIDQSYLAVYGAESGLEDSLYSVRIDRSNTLLASEKLKLDDVCAYDQSGTCTATSHSISSGATWQRSIGEENAFSIAQLASDQSARVDYFDPDSPTAQSNVQSLLLTWNDSCSGNSELETSLVTWTVDPQNNIISFDPASQLVYKQVNHCLSTTQCSQVINTIVAADTPFYDLDPAQPYRFIFHPVFINPTYESCVVKNLTVTAYDHVDATGSVVSLPVRLNIKSTGSFGRSQQALTASIPWKTPPSGLLNFVLFSDESIVK